MNTALRPMYKGETVKWPQAERTVYKLQKRIYRAAEGGNRKQVRRLQKLLLRSRTARLLAVRQVTQDNRGKRSPGVDGKASLTPTERMKLVDELQLEGEASAVRRVEIPKPGTNETRPLGIPTIADRAKQSLVKLVLEPEWEAQFEANSYGFRPGRSTWDAVGAIYVQINQKPKWALDADIAKCFDRIDHATLLRKIDANPAVTRQIKAWLKAGVVDKGELFPTAAGTPQGGTISPLLANIALHGLEELIEHRYPGRNKPALIRYADDLVVLHPDRQVIEQGQALIAAQLSGMGLELKPSKTRITHTLEVTEGEAGFDFLGFNIRQYWVKMSKRGYKTIIKPSRKSIERHRRQVVEVIRRQRNDSQERFIDALNPVIRGWSNYFSTVCSKKTFGKLDCELRQQLRAWIRYRHPQKSLKAGYNKYFHREGGRLDFVPRKGGKRLRDHAETPIKRHVKVQGKRSPFDGDEVYWSSRRGHHPGVAPRVARLLKQQQGKCPQCGGYFKAGDVMEIDHLVARREDGGDKRSNFQLLHRYCHIRKTSQERRRYACPVLHD